MKKKIKLKAVTKMKNKYGVWLIQDKDEPCISNVFILFSKHLSDWR